LPIKVRCPKFAFNEVQFAASQQITDRGTVAGRNHGQIGASREQQPRLARSHLTGADQQAVACFELQECGEEVQGEIRADGRSLYRARQVLKKTRFFCLHNLVLYVMLIFARSETIIAIGGHI